MTWKLNWWHTCTGAQVPNCFERRRGVSIVLICSSRWCQQTQPSWKWGQQQAHKIAVAAVLFPLMFLGQRWDLLVDPPVRFLPSQFSKQAFQISLSPGSSVFWCIMVMLDDRMWIYSLAKRKALFHASLLVHLFCIVFFFMTKCLSLGYVLVLILEIILEPSFALSNKHSQLHSTS